jgi:hypothetical protein
MNMNRFLTLTVEEQGKPGLPDAGWQNRLLNRSLNKIVMVRLSNDDFLPTSFDKFRMTIHKLKADFQIQIMNTTSPYSSRSEFGTGSSKGETRCSKTFKR